MNKTKYIKNNYENGNKINGKINDLNKSSRYSHTHMQNK